MVWGSSRDRLDARRSPRCLRHARNIGRMLLLIVILKLFVIAVILLIRRERRFDRERHERRYGRSRW
jgi:hypothetical protein